MQGDHTYYWKDHRYPLALKEINEYEERVCTQSPTTNTQFGKCHSRAVNIRSPSTFPADFNCLCVYLPPKSLTYHNNLSTSCCGWWTRGSLFYELTIVNILMYYSPFVFFTHVKSNYIHHVIFLLFFSLVSSLIFLILLKTLLEHCRKTDTIAAIVQINFPFFLIK